MYRNPENQDDTKWKEIHTFENRVCGCECGNKDLVLIAHLLTRQLAVSNAVVVGVFSVVLQSTERH